MHTASVRLRGNKVVFIAASIAATFSLWWMAIWMKHHPQSVLTSDLSFSTEQVGAPPVPASAAASKPRGGWVASMFHQAPPADPRTRAVAQIEATGLSLTGDAFVRAVATQHRPLIDLFLQAGIDVNAPGQRGRTAVLTAALLKDWALTDQLLGAGADVNRADARGLTPLMAAAMVNETNALRSFLEHGARIDAADEEGRTALQYAMAARSLETMRQLLDAGAVAEGDSVLATAFDTQDWRIIEPILTRQPAQLKWAPYTRAALMSAIAAHDAAKTKLLLSKHPAAPTPEGRAQPLLAYALLRDDMAQFRFLLDCGADPNTPLNSPVEKAFNQAVPSNFMRDYLGSEGGMTTLMLAAGLGKSDYVRALLDKGAKRWLASSKYKMPALLFAARAENARLMQMLITGAPSPEQLRIEISLGSQRATVYRNGSPSFSTEVSTGKPGHATPTGEFVITDKHLTHHSTIYPAEMPFFMRLNCRDFGMHKGVVPGYPASHGCIRLPESSARFLYKDIPVGTLVSITH